MNPSIPHRRNRKSWPRGCAFLCTISLLLLTNSTIAQDELPEINLFNGETDLCDGILYDSGGPDDTYSGNENIEFTIVSQGIIDISFFGDFCLESGFDYLTIYDGPDTSSPILGSFTGTSLPADITSSGGYLTFEMTSDPSASYCGFSLIWNSTVPPPVPPALSTSPLPACGTTSLPLTFSSSLDCAITEASEFEIIFPQSLDISGFSTPCSSGMSQGVVLELSSPITSNCTFEILWSVSIPDACDSIHLFEVTYSFLYDQCPVTVDALATPDTICLGSSSDLTASSNGCLSYVFQWDQQIPQGPGPHNVNPLSSTLYTVTATELETGLQGSATVQLWVIDPEVTSDPQELCSTAEPFTLTAAQPGTWSGPGIADSATGLFDPSMANPGTNEIIFHYQGCMDTLQIEIIPIDAGPSQSTCPGTDPIQLTGSPLGGVWSGSGIQSDGTFDPASVGIYALYYTQNGCTDSTSMEVANISVSFIPDTLCQSDNDITLAITPANGTWSGSGIIQSDPGVFSPSAASAGDNTLTYTLVGCSESYALYVLPIEIGGNFHTACPDEAPLVWYDGAPTPPGGFWTGDGIIDSSTGLFDPSLFPDDSYTFIAYHAPNGCSDTMTIHVIPTYVTTSVLDLCISDSNYLLDETSTGNGPGQNGQWIGPGVIQAGNQWYFSPLQSGEGTFTIYYEKNNCHDSLVVNVIDPTLQGLPLSFCENTGAVQLPETTVSGIWTGPGVTDAINGWFDTGQALIGSNTLTWTSYNGCSDSGEIMVEEFLQADILLAQDTLCFSSIPVVLDAQPQNGQWSGDLTNNTFIPALMGEGTFQAMYVYAGILCSSADSISITILPQISADITITDSILCPGQATSIAVNAYGGTSIDDISYIWSYSGLSGPYETIEPIASTTINIAITDGCSDTLWLSTFLEVLPEIQIELLLSDTVCFGESGFVQASVTGTGNYEYTWDENEDSSGTLIAAAGTYHELQVTELTDGCTRDTTVLIPAWSPLSASFSLNPNMDCVPYDQASGISIIDYSNNATDGFWNFGNGTIAPYVLGESVDLPYEDPGYYSVSLVIENEGGCMDTAQATLCILPPTPVFIPDIFSPNQDGSNDMLFVRSQGITTIDFRLFNRWGEEVFRTTDIDMGWDGQHRGQPSPEGAYAYRVIAMLNDGEKFEQTGEIFLIR